MRVSPGLGRKRAPFVCLHEQCSTRDPQGWAFVRGIRCKNWISTGTVVLSCCRCQQGLRADVREEDPDLWHARGLWLHRDRDLHHRNAARGVLLSLPLRTVTRQIDPACQTSSLEMWDDPDLDACLRSAWDSQPHTIWDRGTQSASPIRLLVVLPCKKLCADAAVCMLRTRASALAGFCVWRNDW
jgi:hypothetical protein